MADGFPIQTNFTAGEISPYLKGRTDVNRYFNGAEILENFIVKPQGGIIRRSGTHYVSEVKTSANLTVLHKFEFSTNQSYILEFGQGYIRFYKNAVLISGLIGGVITVIEVATPYQSADLRGLSFAQSADVLYIAHPSYPTKTLSRFSDISWVFADFVTSDGPYMSKYGVASLKLTNVIRTSTATATSAIFGVAPVYNIVSGANASSVIRLNVPGHSFVTGDFCSIRDAQEFIFGTPINDAGYQNGSPINTTWVVTVIDASHVDLNGSFFYSGLTFDFSFPATIRKNTNFGDFVQYRVANTWRLAKIKAYVSTTVATVDIITNIKLDAPDGGVFTFNGTQLTCNYSGVFTYSDVGSYFKPHGGAWYKITGFINDSSVYVSTITLSIYSYPGTIVTVTPTITTATVTASASTFVASDVGRKLRLNFFGIQCWGTINIYNSATSVYVSFTTDIPLDPSNTDGVTISNNGVPSSWKLGAWSVATGYPSAVVFHAGRIVFASTLAEPSNIWFSKSADYPNFAPSDLKSIVSDDSAITITIASGEVDSIIWMKSGPVLLLGSLGGEWQIKASTVNETITPTNIIASQQTPFGSCPVPAERIGSSVLFIQRSGTKVREMMYNFQLDQYEAKDLTVVSEHIIRVRGKAVACAYQKEPSSLYWVVTDQGYLVSMTFEKEQEVVAWHNHPIGGNGFVESVAVVPSSGGYDTTYLVVKRTINGATKRYIEYIEAEFWPSSPTDKNNMFFVDSGTISQGGPFSTLNGLDHLEGQTVVVVGDGSLRDPQVVASGTINISGLPAGNVVAGLPYTSKFKMMPIESGSDSGTAQGKTKRLHKLVVRLLNCIGIKMGEDLNNLDEVTFRSPTDHMDNSAPIFSGDKERNYSGSYNPYATLYLVQDKPYPMTVLCVMPHMVTNK